MTEPDTRWKGLLGAVFSALGKTCSLALRLGRRLLARANSLQHGRASPGRILIFPLFAFIIIIANGKGEPALMRGVMPDPMGGPEQIIAGAAFLPQDHSWSFVYDTLSVSTVGAGALSASDPLIWFGDTVGGAADPAGELMEWVSEAAEMITHTVVAGETISDIARHYGISVETILWANNLTAAATINPGDTLRFPSLSGVLHQVRSGQTLSGIAAIYGVGMDRIQTANPGISPASLQAGGQLIIPGGRPAAAGRTAPLAGAGRSAARANVPSPFIMPTTGLNWGRLHHYNATDIANVCGTPIWAAASGVVSRVAYGWNGGYGNMIMIAHPNGMSTLYAHMQAILVETGAPVAQGEQVGTIGNTGRVHGPTGCHLHFEVRGGLNPFIRYR